jgi:hypothetical protein
MRSQPFTSIHASTMTCNRVPLKGTPMCPLAASSGNASDGDSPSLPTGHDHRRERDARLKTSLWPTKSQEFEGWPLLGSTTALGRLEE